MLFILVLALLIFGPKRLPEVGRTIGKGMAQFRRATTDLKRTIENEIALEEELPRQSVRPARPTALQPPPISTTPAAAPLLGPASDGPAEIQPAASSDADKSPPL